MDICNISSLQGRGCFLNDKRAIRKIDKQAEKRHNFVKQKVKQKQRTREKNGVREREEGERERERGGSVGNASSCIEGQVFNKT